MNAEQQKALGRHYQGVHHENWRLFEYKLTQSRASWQVEIKQVRTPGVCHGLDVVAGQKEWMPYVTLFNARDAAGFANLLWSHLGIPARVMVHTLGGESTAADVDRLALQASQLYRDARRHAERSGSDGAFLEIG